MRSPLSWSLRVQCALARSVCLFLYPVLRLQGNLVRRRTPRLPEAAGPYEENWKVKEALHVLVIGESTVAGVGVATCREALAGQIGRHLAEKVSRPVAWRAIGSNGATVKSIRRNDWPSGESEKVDYVVLAFGVNDSLRVRSATEWAKAHQMIFTDLRSFLGSVPVYLAAVPPLGVFSALPQPLRFLLGVRAALLRRASEELSEATPNVTYVPFQFGKGDHLFCADRIHPSNATYAAWGKSIADSIAKP